MQIDISKNDRKKSNPKKIHKDIIVVMICIIMSLLIYKILE